jgi:pimeloyl-ACP methyl ester carboxylesterase
MKRLGYTRYVAQGGDWGSPVSSAMARQAPAGLLGIHINLPATVPSDVAMVLAGGGAVPAGLSEKERAAFDSLDTFFKKYMAYAAMMGTRPQTIGYALTDTPAGLAAWMYDYNNGEPERLLNKDDVLDNITLYWLTNTATSAARLYWETAGQSVVSRRRRRPPRSRSLSPLPSSRTRSIAPRRHGPGAPIATSSTSTRPTRAATSPRGSSLSSSRRRSEPRSGRFGNPDRNPSQQQNRTKGHASCLSG